MYRGGFIPTNNDVWWLMDIVPFEPWHIKAINPQPMQAADLLCMDNEHNGDYAELQHNGTAVTGMVGGKVVFCLGKVRQWHNRHVVWAMFSADSGKHMVAIVRAIKRLIEMQKGEGRLEVIVRSDFEEGCRLVKKFMGFAFHHHEERFLPDGGSADIYVRYV